MDERLIDLVVRAKEGDRDSFAQLFNVYYEKVYILVCAIVTSKKDAEDIMQDTFLRAWTNIGSLSNPAAFHAWLQKIATNLCYRYQHNQGVRILRDAKLEQDEEAAAASERVDPSDELIPSAYVEREDLKQRLHRIISELPPAQKQALTLYYFDGLKVSVIAQVMDCSVSTVTTRLHLARKTILLEITLWEEKTGEKFYGMAGVPLLPIGDALVSALRLNTIDPATAENILERILPRPAQSPANPTPKGHPQAQPLAAGVSIASKPSRRAKGMPTAAKVVSGLVAVAAVGLGMYLLAQGNGSPSPAPAAQPAHTAAAVAPLADTPQSPAETPAPPTAFIQWEDPAFEAALRQYLQIPDRPIGVEEAAQHQILQLQLPAGTISLVDLKHFPQLEILELLASGTRLNLQPLAQATALRELYLTNAQASGFETLAQLPKLRWLSLDDMNLPQPEFLSTLTGLELLHLSGSSSFDLSLLSGLSRLESLRVSDTQLTGLPSLAKLTALKWLSLAHTNLADVQPLSGLGDLRWLDVSYTQVTDLSPLLEGANPPTIHTEGLSVAGVTAG